MQCPKQVILVLKYTPSACLEIYPLYSTGHPPFALAPLPGSPSIFSLDHSLQGIGTADHMRSLDD